MIEIYREPSSHLISVPWQGVILDRGVLKKAIKNSKGEYVFSEFGAGVQPLVVIGRFPELVNFFYNNRNVIISNEIEPLPDLFIGVSKFVEKRRYDGTYPLHEAINSFTKSVLDYIPGNTIVDVLSNSATFGSILHDLLGHHSDPKNLDVLYLKISYFNDVEDTGKKIGTKKVSFETVLRYLLGVKETSI